MIVVDVNVLVYAHRQDSESHDPARAWLEDKLGTPGEDIVIPDLVWVGFARVSTNARVFREPSTINDVSAFVREIVSQPTYRAIPGLSTGIEPLLTEIDQGQARGNLVVDAYIASVARHIGASVATFDRDFRRFDGLRLITPGQTESHFGT
ncbi:MAG: PIN domain-containing protein [Propionibacteriaceae bacterium]|nr:PIN domain-containing protein [Propionibacteriaceae bacterium]